MGIFEAAKGVGALIQKNELTLIYREHVFILNEYNPSLRGIRFLFFFILASTLLTDSGVAPVKAEKSEPWGK